MFIPDTASRINDNSAFIFTDFFIFSLLFSIIHSYRMKKQLSVKLSFPKRITVTETVQCFSWISVTKIIQFICLLKLFVMNYKAIVCIILFVFGLNVIECTFFTYSDQLYKEFITFYFCIHFISIIGK